MKTTKQFVLLLLSFMSIDFHGQDTNKETETTDFKKFQIGISISPDYCFRTLIKNNGGETNDFIYSYRNNMEVYKIGYTSGFNFCYNIKKNIGIEAGIHYSNKGYQTKTYDLSFGRPDPSLPTKAKFVYNMNYIDVPLKVNFAIGKNKIRLFTSAGFATNIFLNETVKTILEYEDHSSKETNPTNYKYKIINISPLVSAGLDWQLNSRMNLRVEPSFRYGVLKIVDTPVTARLWSTGLNVGYYFGF